MNTTAGAMIAVLAALAAAGSFGVAAVLQHRQASETAEGQTLRLRLLSDLARRPAWLAGIALAATAYGLQGLALTFGPLALVAPIVATDLLFALPLAARWSRWPLRRRDWTGCALVAGGIGVFLATSPPSSGRSDAPAWEWLLAFGAVALVCAAAVAVSKTSGQTLRAGTLAAAAGVTFGLTAAVTLSFARLLRHVGLPTSLGHWQPWALISLGLAGLLLSQSAYQAGALAVSLPIIDTLEPISGVVIGTAIFDEHLAASPAALALQLAAAAIAVAGIALLDPASMAPGVIAATAAAAAGPLPTPDRHGPDDKCGSIQPSHREFPGMPPSAAASRAERGAASPGRARGELRHAAQQPRRRADPPAAQIVGDLAGVEAGSQLAPRHDLPSYRRSR